MSKPTAVSAHYFHTYWSITVLVDAFLLRVDNFANFEIFGNFLAVGSVDLDETTNKAALGAAF